MTVHHMPLNLSVELKRRYESKQSIHSAVWNVLKDGLRANYENYTEARDKQTFCKNLLGNLLRNDVVLSFANDNDIWTSVPTIFGNGRHLSSFGTWLRAVVEYVDKISPEELDRLVTSVREYVN